MAVIALTSARGAPGVTTTALGMTFVWQRPVILVEADVRGGSAIVSGYLRAHPTDWHTLLDAAIAHQQGKLRDRFFSLTMPLPYDQQDSQRRLLPSITRANQAASLDDLWPALADHASSLERAGVDVIVDAGVLGQLHGPRPILRTADLVLLLTRPTLPAVDAARAGSAAIRDDLRTLGRGDDALGLVTVGQSSLVPGRDRHFYRASEIRDILDLPLIGSVTYDPQSAEVLSLGADPQRRWQRSPFIGSLRAVATAAESHARRHLEHVAPAAGEQS